MNNQKLKNFFMFVQKLKIINRKGWLIKTDIKKVESVADHSYSATTMAMVCSDILKLDTEKVMKMMLIHDLPESIIGDLLPGLNPNKSREENDAMIKIINILPKEIQDDYIEIWKELRKSESKEAILVHEIDKLELMMQLLAYKEHLSKKSIKEFLRSSESKINSKLTRDIFDNIVYELE